MAVDPARARLLAPLAEAPGESALVLDVDGTLAPIVARPELSAVPDETRAELARLAGRYRLVACVSGRAGDDARRPRRLSTNRHEIGAPTAQTRADFVDTLEAGGGRKSPVPTLGWGTARAAIC